MKSPNEVSKRLRKQWERADTREQRLLQPEGWPIQLRLGKPSATELCEQLSKVLEHVQAWRAIETGTVIWQDFKYQSTENAVAIPMVWQLHTPSEWVSTMDDASIQLEYDKLGSIVKTAEPQFHSLLVRQRQFILEKTEAEISQAMQLALELEPGLAQGMPLRSISLVGIDSKFFERHRKLINALLDVRFKNAVNDQGLETFLDAAHDNDHWLLVVDLDGDLLPFQRQRVRDEELRSRPLPASHIIIVENEQCVHQLPTLSNTIAILGAGLNLSWMTNSWLGAKQLAYWGDIDTWGLKMLARAREHQSHLEPILMVESLYTSFCDQRATIEPSHAGETPPDSLNREETELYRRLVRAKRGRLEQEFIPKDLVYSAFERWLLGTN